MKKYIANAVTGIRILGSILLVFVPMFSVLFYAVYLICGLSDMIDGMIARKTDSTSSFGAKLDTVADSLLTAVLLAKLMINIPIPGWLWLWSAVIALIKVVNMGFGFIKSKSLVSVHSTMNKVTGLLLFLFPLTLGLIELKYSAVVICSMATVSAIQEGYFIGTGRMLVMGGKGRKPMKIETKHFLHIASAMRNGRIKKYQRRLSNENT